MTVEKKAIIKVGNKDVDNLLGLDIIAIQFAEGGAQGYHGGVFFVTSDRKVFFTCYLEPSEYTNYAEQMSWENLEKVLPPLKELHNYIANRYAVVLREWGYKYLGAGNHLLVKDTILDEFEKKYEALLNEEPELILYNLWLEAVLKIPR